jgi:hypothetical protein
MKINGNSTQGSMGIPPEIQEAAERARQRSAQNVKKSEEAAEQHDPVNKVAEASNPVEILKKLGIEFDDDTFQSLLFKGYVEHVVEIVKGRFSVKFKSLTTDEYDLVDELLAKDLQDTSMTNEGFNSRRAMWILAFGVLELAGKPVCKPVLDKDRKLDVIETVKLRRQVLGKMAPAVINIMIQKHGAMTVALNMISSNPEEHIKNS